MRTYTLLLVALFLILKTTSLVKEQNKTTLFLSPPKVKTRVGQVVRIRAYIKTRGANSITYARARFEYDPSYLDFQAVSPSDTCKDLYHRISSNQSKKSASIVTEQGISPNDSKKPYGTICFTELVFRTKLAGTTDVGINSNMEEMKATDGNINYELQPDKSETSYLSIGP